MLHRRSFVVERTCSHACGQIWSKATQTGPRYSVGIVSSLSSLVESSQVGPASGLLRLFQPSCSGCILATPDSKNMPTWADPVSETSADASFQSTRCWWRATARRLLPCGQARADFSRGMESSQLIVQRLCIVVSVVGFLVPVVAVVLQILDLRAKFGYRLESGDSAGFVTKPFHNFFSSKSNVVTARRAAIDVVASAMLCCGHDLLLL